MAEQADDPYAPTAPGSRPLEEPPPAAPDPGLVGKRLGVYHILEEVGRGGMGVVYRARDKSLDRDVAVKVLQPSLARDAEFERRFVREARTAAKLDHPNIVQVYTAGRNDDVLFIAMQFVQGRTLHELLRARGRLPVPEALGIIRQAAEALDTAHRADLVHRDIKPNNIMLDASGRVKLMDFGLMRSSAAPEKITQAGEFFGTPEYASPEQCETAVLDGRSDIYSLGAVLYEMLAGRMPHKADTPLALFDKIRKEEPAPLRSLNPAVTPGVEALVRRMMAKKPADRFPSAAALAAAVRELETEPAAPARRSWVGAALATAAVLVALVVAMVWPKGSAVTPPAPPPPLAKVERMKLVVFDFKQGIPNAETAWYEIALSDLLIASLAQQPFLDVPTREQLLWKLKERKLGGKVTEENRRVLVQDLGAHAYLSGTCYVQAGKVRVTLVCHRLPANEPAFSSRTFDRPEADLFSMVDEISKTVAAELKGVAAEVVREVKPAPDVRSVEMLALAYQAPPSDKLKDEKLAKAEPVLREADRERDDSLDAMRRVVRGIQQVEKKSPPVPGADRGKELAAKPQAGAAPPAPATAAPAPAQQQSHAERRKADAPAMSQRELVQAWYHNLQTLEQCKFEKEDFEELAKGLRDQFQAGAVDAAAWKQGVENFQDGLNRAQEGRHRGVRGSVEFVCPGCKAIAPRWGKCEPCDRALVLRVKVAEKKE